MVCGHKLETFTKYRFEKLAANNFNYLLPVLNLLKNEFSFYVITFFLEVFGTLALFT